MGCRAPRCLQPLQTAGLLQTAGSLSPGDITIHEDPEHPSRSHRAPARHPLLQPAVLQITKKSFQNKGTGAAGAQSCVHRASAVVAALNRAAEGDGAERSEPPSSGVGLAPRRRRVAASCAAGSASPCRHSSPTRGSSGPEELQRLLIDRKKSRRLLGRARSCSGRARS